MDRHSGELVVLRPDAFGVPDVLDAVRGVLAVALQRCGEGSDAGLEICAAWEAIDEVSASSSILESGSRPASARRRRRNGAPAPARGDPAGRAGRRRRSCSRRRSARGRGRRASRRRVDLRAVRRGADLRGADGGRDPLRRRWPSPRRRDQATALLVGRLQDDLAVQLAEMTETVTGLRMGAAIQPEIADLVRHPVRLLRGGLVVAAAHRPIARLPAAVRPGGRDRRRARPRRPGRCRCGRDWSLPPPRPARALRAQAQHLSGAQRWAALGKIAALAEVLAVTRSDLLTSSARTPAATRVRARRPPPSPSRRARSSGWPGTPAEPDGRAWDPRPPEPPHRAGVLARRVAELRWTTSAGSSRAAMRRSPTCSPSPGCSRRPIAPRSPCSARQAASEPTGRDLAGLLASHSDALAVAVTRARANVASLIPGSPAVLAQGREIGAAGLPTAARRRGAPEPGPCRRPAPHRLCRRRRPARPSPCATPRRAPSPSTRSRCATAPTTPPSCGVPPRASTSRPSCESLDEAARTARRAAIVATTDPPGLGAERALRASTAQLREALARRQVAMRPEAPTTAALTAEFEPLGARRAALGA